MTDRPIDTYHWQPCRLDYGLEFLWKLVCFEVQAQAMPHSEGWGNLNGDDPPIEFIRAMIGGQALDELNAVLVEAGTVEDLTDLLVELS